MTEPSIQNAPSIQSDLQLARDLADMADSISIDRFRANDLLVTMKPDMTHVSDADRAVEAAIRGGLADSRPGDGILGEEFGTETGETGRRQWIIDPIDGTANFVFFFFFFFFFAVKTPARGADVSRPG